MEKRSKYGYPFEPIRKRAFRFMWKLALFVAVIIGILMLFTASAGAHQKSVTLGKGMFICDTKEEVLRFLESLTATGSVLPEGCGYLTRPILAHAEVIAGYENENFTTTITRYEIPFLDGTMGLQFGFINLRENKKAGASA